MKNKTILFVVLFTVFIIAIYNSYHKSNLMEEFGRGGGGRGGGGGLGHGGLRGGGLRGGGFGLRGGGFGLRRGLGIGALGLGGYNLYGGGGGYYGGGGGGGGYGGDINNIYYYPYEQLPVVYDKLL